jgi:hypothetical protein
MTRKDSEKDTDRPHYYSQFWLDVAAGRRVIGTPKPEEGADQAEAETLEPEPIPLRKVGRNSTAAAADGYRETRSQNVVEPEEHVPDEYVEPDEDEIDLADNVDDLELPTIDVEDTFDDVDSADDDLVLEEPEEEEPEEEDYFDEEVEEEEEDDDGEWAGRGRKKPKPGRQVKPPKQQKKPKRERRGF